MAQHLSHPEREGQVERSVPPCFTKANKEQEPEPATIQALALCYCQDMADPGLQFRLHWPLVFHPQASPASHNFISSKATRGVWGTNMRVGPGRLPEAFTPWHWRTPKTVQRLQNMWDAVPEALRIYLWVLGWAPFSLLSTDSHHFTMWLVDPGQLLFKTLSIIF